MQDCNRDAELIDRIRRGDGEALDTLLRTHADSLFATAIHVVRDSHLAQDIVQDVFVWIWTHRETLAIQGSITAYLHRSVRNRSFDYVVRERRRQQLAVDNADATPVVLTQGQTQDDNGLLSSVRQALDHLSPRLRDVVLMRVDQELSYEDIAEVLGVQVTSVHKQMYRAVKELRALLSRNT